MHIVYLLTNKTKTEGRRFYIGSKQECYLLQVDGVDTIISANTGKPYYSSSSSLEMKDDMLAGHIFEASILQQDIDRKELLQIENNFITQNNAVFSNEYYNKSNAVLNCHDQEAVCNRFGQTVKDLATDNSAISKKDQTATRLGFNNFGELCFKIDELYKASLKPSWAEVSRHFGQDRHWSGIYIKGFDMDKAREDLKLSAKKVELRKYVAENCSLRYAAKLLDLEYPAARVLLGDFYKPKERNFSLALLSGKSKDELEVEITKYILDGYTLEEVSKIMAIGVRSVKDYFLRCVRKRLKSSDL